MDRGLTPATIFRSMTKRQTWEAAGVRSLWPFYTRQEGPLVLPRLRRSLAVDRLGALNGGRIVRLGLPRYYPFKPKQLDSADAG